MRDYYNKEININDMVVIAYHSDSWRQNIEFKVGKVVRIGHKSITIMLSNGKKAVSYKPNRILILGELL